jgi:hypothetical protein
MSSHEQMQSVGNRLKDEDLPNIWNNPESVNSFNYNGLLRRLLSNPSKRMKEYALENKESFTSAGVELAKGAVRMGKLFSVCHRLEAFPGGDFEEHILSLCESFSRDVMRSDKPRVPAALLHYSRGVCAFLSGVVTGLPTNMGEFQPHFSQMQPLLMSSKTIGKEPFNEFVMDMVGKDAMFTEKEKGKGIFVRTNEPSRGQLMIKRNSFAQSELNTISSYVKHQYIEFEKELALMSPPSANGPRLEVKRSTTGAPANSAKKTKSGGKLVASAPAPAQMPKGLPRFIEIEKMSDDEQSRLNAYHAELDEMKRELKADVERGNMRVRVFVSSLGGVGRYSDSKIRRENNLLATNPRVVFDPDSRWDAEQFQRSVAEQEEETYSVFRAEQFSKYAATMGAIVNDAIEGNLTNELGKGKENKVFHIRDEGNSSAIKTLIAKFPFTPSPERCSDSSANPGKEQDQGALRITARVEGKVKSLSIEDACTVAMNYLIASQSCIGPYVRNVFIFNASRYREDSNAKGYGVAIFMQKMNKVVTQNDKTATSTWKLMRNAARAGLLYTDFNHGNLMVSGNGTTKLVDFDSAYSFFLEPKEIEGSINSVSALDVLYALNVLFYMSSIFRNPLFAEEFQFFVLHHESGKALRNSVRIENIAHYYDSVLTSEGDSDASVPMKLFGLSWTGGRMGKQAKDNSITDSSRFGILEHAVRINVYHRTVEGTLDYIKTLNRESNPLILKALGPIMQTYSKPRNPPVPIGSLMSRFMFLPNMIEDLGDKNVGEISDMIQGNI